MSPEDRHVRRRVIAFAAVALVIVAVGSVPLLAVTPVVWTRAMWTTELATAAELDDYAEVEPGASYGLLVSELGYPIEERPGFTTRGHVNAAVCCWHTEQGEVRGLVIDDRLEGPLRIGEW